MSEIKMVMKFEFLPNEIFIECFEYLNTFDIFHSFDQLNYRFNQLIRSICLHVNFQHVQKSTFDEFYTKMLCDQDIKNQIYSLHLSNKDTYYPIQLFLLTFSFVNFPNLRSLTLTAATSENILILKTVLSSVSQLSCFHLMNSRDKQNEILCALSMCPLRTLTLPYLPSDINRIYEFSSITNLTIVRCNIDGLYQILNNVSSIKYLSIEDLSGYTSRSEKKDLFSTNLKQLIIMCCFIGFDDLEMILKQTRTLKSLIIVKLAHGKIDMIDASRWEYMITSSLHDLISFKFKFKCSIQDENIVEKKFKEFQSDFWCKLNHWHTEYFVSKELSVIYTTPYIFDSYELIPFTYKCCNKFMNNVITVDSARNLTIDPDAVTEECQHRFSHVNSLIFQETCPIDGNLVRMGHIECLKNIVNFSNIKHLAMISYNILNTPSVLIEILKDASQLSSLEIHLNKLIPFFDDDELCMYLNKMIKILDLEVDGKYFLDNLDKTKQFCLVFSNIEQITCTIDDKDSLLFLIKHLPKLLLLKIRSPPSPFHDEISWIKEEAQKLDIKLFTEYYDYDYTYLAIWIMRNVVLII